MGALKALALLALVACANGALAPPSGALCRARRSAGVDGVGRLHRTGGALVLSKC